MEAVTSEYQSRSGAHAVRQGPETTLSMREVADGVDCIGGELASALVRARAIEVHLAGERPTAEPNDGKTRSVRAAPTGLVARLGEEVMAQRGLLASLHGALASIERELGL